MSSYRWAFAALFLASAACAAPIDDAWERASAPYRKALLATNTGDASGARAATAQFREEWERFREAYGSRPPKPYGRDRAWSSEVARIGEWAAEAERKVAAGDLPGAHETLERVRERWMALRTRNGVRWFADGMTRFHTDMEALIPALGDGPEELSGPVLWPRVAATVRRMERTLADLPRSQGPVLPDSEARERAAMLALLRQRLAAVRVAVAQRDATASRAAVREMKPAFVKLFLRFG